MIRFLVFIFTFSVFTQLFSQTQSIAYTAVGKGVATTFLTDYQCLGVNVSALGWGSGYDRKKVTMGSTEFGFSLYSDALTSDKLRKLYSNLTNSYFKNKEISAIDYNKQKEAVAMFAQSGVAFDVNYNWGGFAYQSKLLGGIAFNVSENYSWYSKLSAKTSDLIFRGKTGSLFDSLTIVNPSGDTTTIQNSSNLTADSMSMVISGSFGIPLKLSQLTYGTEIRSVWNRSFNFGYGRKIIGFNGIELFGGIGYRYIMSMAMFNLKSDENGLYMFSSTSPKLNINYNDVSNGNSSNLIEKSGLSKNSVGIGHGWDFALSAKLFDKFKVAVSVNNVGSVKYKRNVYRVKDTLVSSFSFNGITDFNITKSVNQMLSSGGLLSLEGEQIYIVKNSANFRFGASYELRKLLSIGFDLVAPFNRETPGSIQNTFFSFGGEIRPIPFIAISTGYVLGGIYKNNIPLGINFILGNGRYEFGVSSYNISSIFYKESHSISAAFGFARIRF
jgi:hypothetical protein